MRPLALVLSVLLSLGFAAQSRAQSFSLGANTVEIVAVPTVNHLPKVVPITYSPAGLDYSQVQVASDANWVVPTIDPATGNLVLTFTTGQLISRSNTATVTVTSGATSAQLFVKATVSLFSIVALQPDPLRSRVYGLQQDGTNAGSVVIFDPLGDKYVGNLTVGRKPADLSVSADGAELLVICAASKSIHVVDLQKLAVTQVIALVDYTDWDSSATATSAHIAHGPGNIIYYSDGAWTPNLRVFDRSSAAVVQTLAGCGTTSYGFGDFVVSADRRRLFAWGQYGWTAGMASSFAASYTVAADGKLTLLQETVPTWPSGMNREPVDTPALISRDGTIVVLKQYVLDPSALTPPLQVTPTPVYSLSPGGEILCTSSAIFQVGTGNKLLDLPVSSTVQTVTLDASRLVYFNAVSRSLATVNLSVTLSESVMGRNRSPSGGAIVLPPQQLEWSPALGVSTYRVYLGTSATAVSQATPTSPLYLGETAAPTISLTTALLPVTTYYWRVDAVTPTEVVKGSVSSFTVSEVAANVSALAAATVRVHKKHIVRVALTSELAGKTWSASTANPWISFATDSGVTPASLDVWLDATQLSGGATHSGAIKVVTDLGEFSIPVSLRVDALKLTHLRTSPGSTQAYGISEDTSVELSPAYLLEIDCLTKEVKRVVRVGSGVTDLAVHRADNRVYVTNWKSGALLAVNMDTLELERTYAFTPSDPSGYREDDVYRVSPGAAGRLVVEPEDQWVDVKLFDTVTGTSLAETYEREGGGGSDPTGRYYYHGDNDSSGSQLHRFELTGDTFTELATAGVSGVSYYGSRTVVVSEQGNRIFWNGGAFSAALGIDWLIGDEIFSASGDGRFAFSKTKIYDVDKKVVLGEMPAAATVSAFNSATNRLVLQNGEDLGFYHLVGLGLLGMDMSPMDQAVVLEPSELRWNALPGVSGYDVYYGTSQAAVAAATEASAEYRGEVSSASFTLGTSLASGTTYYWRIDPITIDGPVMGDVAAFTVAAIAPSLFAIDATTVQVDPGYRVSIDLAASSPGLAWSASSPDAWVKFVATSGSTPGTLEVILDPAGLAVGHHESTLVVSAEGGGFTLPVTLKIDPINLTVIRSDPDSEKVYAVSEQTSDTGVGKAYLLEIDTELERVTRVAPAGGSVTDLAIHRGENRIYVTNWKLGSLLAFDRTSFALVRTYPFKAFTSAGYGDADVYRVSAGSTGRLIVEEQDQWVNISIYDTVAGATLGEAHVREGGGGYSPDNRYYYHGENNSSGAGLIKFDTVADQFTSVVHVPAPTGGGYYGSRTVVVTENGNRVFWNGAVFTDQLAVEWVIGDTIYAASADGRWVFADSKIYDLDQRKAVLGMPAPGAVSAFNSTSAKLVLQTGAHMGYFVVDPSLPLPTPLLRVGTRASGSITLEWDGAGLQTGFTLQSRKSGTDQWTDVTSTLGGNVRTYVVTGLDVETTYEFRLKADSPALSSTWSAPIVATTAPPPPAIQPSAPSRPADIGRELELSVVATGAEPLTYQWRRRAAEGYAWENLTDGATYSGTATAVLRISSVTTEMIGDTFLCLVSNEGGESTSGNQTIVQDCRGVYFGQSSSGGLWALYVRPDQSGVFLAYSPGRQSAVIAPIVLGATGTFERYVTETGVGSSWGYYLFGQIRGTTVSATGNFNEVFSGTLETAATSAPAGYYLASALHPSSGALHAILGANGRTLAVALTSRSVDAVTGSVDGNGRLTVTSASGTTLTLALNATNQSIAATTTPTGGGTTVNYAGLSDAVVARKQLVNISTRAFGGTGNNVAIGGFVINGTAPKKLLLRAVGPTLSTRGLGVSEVMVDPGIDVYDALHGDARVASVDNWSDNADPTLIVSTAARLGASPLAGSDATSAAVLLTLQPGVYTFIARGKESGTGVVLVEAYDADESMEGSRMVNISTRAYCTTGNGVSIAGFVVNGNAPKRLLLRAVGPTLATKGLSVDEVLADPVISVHDALHENAVIATNDNWSANLNAYEITVTAARLGATPLAQNDVRSSALLMTLPPGVYSFVASGAGGTSGIVLVEVYDAD